MQAPNLRYYAFVARFVDAVTTEALTIEVQRARLARMFERGRSAPAEASGTVPVTKRAA
ncbi:MAG: hypothetical protein K1X88_05820 [Nannocystaceae bacterium]|nr:hypothetical protein [Nannocystaceae bacterium]